MQRLLFPRNTMGRVGGSKYFWVSGLDSDVQCFCLRAHHEVVTTSKTQAHIESAVLGKLCVELRLESFQSLLSAGNSLFSQTPAAIHAL